MRGLRPKVDGDSAHRDSPPQGKVTNHIDAEQDRAEGTRRIVLLGADDHGSHERVLCEPSADNLHAEVVRQAIAHPGRRVAGEHMSKGEWIRWVWAGERNAP